MEQTILHIALSNALVATLLAVVALAVTLAFRRPALAHAAWMLVLLKLLTPPLFTVPIDLPRPSQITTESAALTPAIAQVHDVQTGLLPEHPQTYLSIEEPVAVEQAAPSPAPLIQTQPDRTLLSDNWPTLLILAWATGSVLVLTLILARLLRFRRVLRYAAPATEDVQDQVRALCDDLEIRPVPSVWFVPGGVCPMLIGLGRASRILVPRDLWGRLDERQRGTLLVHELAHLRRGDQWVRLVELLVTVLYWWHPVAWFARRELREAEEQCCDAWVVWAMPRSARDYAVALMEAIDTTTRSRPMIRPVLGSGMGEFHHLRRRLIMIKQGKVARALTWSGFGAMCGVGALLLPLSPTLAFQDKTTEEPAADPFSVVERLDDINGLVVVLEDVVPPPPLPTPAPAAENPGGPVTAEPADLHQFQLQVEAQQAQAAQQAQRAEQQALNAELQATRQMIQQLSQQLERAHARLAELEARRGGAAGRGVRPGGMPGERWVMPRKIDPRTMPPGGMPQTVKPVQPMQPKNAPQAGIAPRTESVRPPTVRWAPARPEGKTDRLDALEERLAALLDEVRTLKQERKDDRSENGKPTEALPPATPAPAAPASR